jgi:hypothetical protein
MSPDEAAVDLPAANARLAKMNLSRPETEGPLHVPFDTIEWGDGKAEPLQPNTQPAPRARRTRSDAGRPRPPKPAAPQPAQASAGGLTEIQLNGIKMRVELIQQLTERKAEAIKALRNVEVELDTYLDSLRSVPHA